MANFGGRGRKIALVASVGLGLVLSGFGAVPSAAAPVAGGQQSASPGEVVPAVAAEESAAVDQARSTGKPVEVVSKTDETSITFADPDGTVSTKLSSVPVRAKAEGVWAEIDTDLKSATGSEGSVLVPGNALADVKIGAGGTDVMAYVGDRAGAAVTQKWPFGPLPTAAVDGDTATYSEVLPGVDLVQIARADGLSAVADIGY